MSDGKREEGQQDQDFESWLEALDNEQLQEVLRVVRRRDPHQPEFHQAVLGVACALQPLFARRSELLPVFARMCEPERTISFRVAWLDDRNEVQVNRGFRVQFNSAVGPYKGGLRFHPSVNLSICKFLGFEQILKNSLTTLPLGGAKGGADFDPKGKSDGEVMRFCQSFMTELARFIGQSTDIPAGDVGVGAKEVGYLYGQWKRLAVEHAPALTGLGAEWGGSDLRPEATGFGVVFFAEELLADRGDTLQGKRCLVSGSGNVAQHCAAKLVERGAVVLAMSDSRGCIYKPAGLTQQDVDQVKRIKARRGASLEELEAEGVEYRGDRAKPWQLGCEFDVALPCATQNEVQLEDARSMTQHGCCCLLEGANMPCSREAVEHLSQSGAVYVPGKAANAGGVAVSALEIFQHRSGMKLPREEVESRLRKVMRSIFAACKDAADEFGCSLADGASIAGFVKVAEAMGAQGAV